MTIIVLKAKLARIAAPLTVRRPDVNRLAAKLKRQHPEWSDARCAAEAKTQWCAQYQAGKVGGRRS